jgi:hypothetical protein
MPNGTVRGVKWEGLIPTESVLAGKEEIYRAI